MGKLKTYTGTVHTTERIDMKRLRGSAHDFYVVESSKKAASARAAELGWQPYGLSVASSDLHYHELGWLKEAGDIVFVSQGSGDYVARAYAGDTYAHFAGKWEWSNELNRRVLITSPQDAEVAASERGRERHQLMLSLRPFDLEHTTTAGDVVHDETCISESTIRDAVAALMADPLVAEIRLRRRPTKPTSR